MSKLKLTILDFYIIRKFLGTFFFSISLILVIVIIFDISEKIDDFLESDAPLKQIVFRYYLNFIPYFVNLFSYLFTFIAVIFFTSKMASDMEIVAMLSAGISFRRLLVPYLISAFFLAIMSFVLLNFIIPPANMIRIDFENTYIHNNSRKYDKNIHMQLSPGTYIYMKNFDNDNVGYNFGLEKYKDNKLYYRLSARDIRWDSLTSHWKINDYYIREIDGLKEHLSYGKQIDTALSFMPQDLSYKVVNVDVMNFMELRDFIEKEKIKGSENIDFYLVEKYKRIAYPFATVILTLIGVALSSRKVRGGIGLHLGLGIGISFAFILFMQIATVFATFGNIPPSLAVWIPNCVFLILAFYLLKRAPK